MRLGRAAAFAVGVASAGALLAAPAPVKRRVKPTVRGLVDDARESGLVGRDLVDLAIGLVNDAFPYHSTWTLLEPAALALARGRGWSHQYNRVLLDVLHGLGFEARLVHAARVQGWRAPWFFTGHTWVKVNLEGRWLDACASRSGNKLGETGFIPVTDELPYRRSTRLTVTAMLTPLVVGAVWRARLEHRPVPTWVYSPRP